MRNPNVNSVLRLVVNNFSPAVEDPMPDDGTRTVVAHDLQPGDLLISSAIGGHSGRIYSVHLSVPRFVRVIFEPPGQSAELAWWEICTVRRNEKPEAA